MAYRFALLVCAFALALGGCAFTDTTDYRLFPPLPGTEGTWVDGLYSRNEAVAVPTLIGNVAGGAVGAALVLLLIPISLLAGDRVEPIVPWILVGPVYVGGGITGTPFLPIALVLPEHRWILGPRDPNWWYHSRLESAAQRIEADAARAENASEEAQGSARRAQAAAEHIERLLRSRKSAR